MRTYSYRADFPYVWLPILLAPEGVDLELGVLGKAGITALSFPCRRASGIWFNVWAGEPTLIFPSYWRIWRR